MLADKPPIANLDYYRDEIWQFFKARQELTLWFYRSIIEANQEGERGYLLQEL